MEERVVYVEEVEQSTYNPFAKFWKVIKANVLALVLMVVISGAIGIGLGFIVAKPNYTAQYNIILKLAVDSEGYSDEQVMSNNTTLAKNYLPTIKDVILSPKTIIQARTYGNADISSKKVGVNYGLDSLIFKLSYKDVSEQGAISKLEDVLTAAQEQLTEEKPIVATEIKLVKTQDNCIITKDDNRSIFIILGFVGGLVIAFGYCLIRVLLEKPEEETIKEKEDK